MRNNLRAMGFDQVPQLTSSRLVDINKTMHIVPPGSNGRRRAVLIGINYTGQQGQLSGCHNGMFICDDSDRDYDGRLQRAWSIQFLGPSLSQIRDCR